MTRGGREPSDDAGEGGRGCVAVGVVRLGRLVTVVEVVGVSEGEVARHCV